MLAISARDIIMVPKPTKVQRNDHQRPANPPLMRPWVFALSISASTVLEVIVKMDYLHQKILPCRRQHHCEGESRQSTEIPHELLLLAHAIHIFLVAFGVSVNALAANIIEHFAIIIDLVLRGKLLRVQRRVSFLLKMRRRHPGANAVTLGLCSEM